MKEFALAIALLMAPLPTLACPGGNMKSLSVDGRQLAEINMSDSSIRLTDTTAKIVAISTIRSKSYDSYAQCGQSMECEASDLLAIDVLEDPQAVVVVHIREANANSSQIFKVTNFQIARSMNSCGQIVEPLQ